MLSIAKQICSQNVNGFIQGIKPIGVFFPSKANRDKNQTDTKKDQSGYGVSIDQSQASILIHSLLLIFYSIYFLFFLLHDFNLLTFCERNS